MASHFCFIMFSRRLPFRKALFSLCLLAGVLAAAPGWAQGGKPDPPFPLDMNRLLAALSDAHQPEANPAPYPRTLVYRHQRWNMLDDSLSDEQVTLRIEHQPQRIIPHSVGLAEVLWAITPHERIASVHESCTTPAYSFLAGQLPETLPTYGSDDAELVIGLRPDLVLTTYYSSAAFKNRLHLSHIPFVEIGFFGDITDIKRQIQFLGDLVGAEAGAQKLLTTIDQSVATIQRIVKERLAGRTLRVLYYDQMGFVAGAHTTFDALCRTLGIDNVAAQNGLKFFKQVEYETVLKWDPDIIIVPADSGLDQQLMQQPILALAKAVRNHKVRTIPGEYLMASSQFIVASLNYLGGVVDAE